MKLGEKGRQLLQEAEGLKLHVYKDVAGLETIGIGHLLTKKEKAAKAVFINSKPFPYQNGLSELVCWQLFNCDIAPIEKCIDEHVKVELSQWQHDALVCFIFNVGIGAFKDSTLLKLLNQRKYADVPAQLMRWTKAGGKEVKGLVNRRKKEVALWETKPLRF